MKPVTLLLGLLISTPALANWELHASNESFDYYYKKESIKRNGNFIRVWTLQDIKNDKGRTQEGELSRRSYDEVDCKESRFRSLSLDLFSGQMAQGEIVFAIKDADRWRFIPPDSAMEILEKLICKR